MEVREALYQCSHDDSDFDLALKVWCVAAEDGLLAASRAAGGPLPQGGRPFQGWSKVETRTRRIGGRTPGRFHRPVQAEDVDTANFHFPLILHLEPVILLWRRLHTVCQALMGIGTSDFSTARCGGRLSVVRGQ